ncbi:hypothetical protein NDU88_003067 [Pleurodeles waltl]|uniref:Uncharacterized protein n=1 Tax=Pleurodeles waltl TaxID=8319 RepID=A0AAV7NFI8_PLEWA|nr:hypothetical protein NDU88_003067 [Pleurodeles waltl]
MAIPRTTEDFHLSVPNGEFLGGTSEISALEMSEVRDPCKKEETGRRGDTGWRSRPDIASNEEEEGRETKA